MRCITIVTFTAATLSACGPHIAHPPHRPSERHNAPTLILPMASPDGPAVSSGGSAGRMLDGRTWDQMPEASHG